MKYSPILRTIALALVVSFSVQEMAHAGSVSSPPSIFAAPKISQLNIPDAFANVRDTFEAKGQRKSPLLIHIQDAHTNTSAQLNLSKTLGYLVREKGIHTIFMEGGTQDDSLTFLRNSADAATRERVAKQFLMRGELNGAEHLNLSSDLDMRLLGVEDKDLYETNLRLYAEMVVHREDVLSYIEKLESRANELKASFYPKEILDFDAFLSAFEKKEKDFTEYYDRLSAMAEKSGIHTPYFPNFESLKNLKVLEGRIDFNKANEEQAALMTQLSGEDFGEWSEKLEKIRSQNYSAYPFYVELFAKAAAKNISLTAYPNLQRYAEYLKAYSTVDFESLFSETGMLQEAVYRKSLAGSDAYYLYEISDFLSLLKKLFRMQITADEFQKYLNYRRDPQFETVAMLAFMNRAFFDRSKDDGILDYVPAIEQYEKKAGQFYLNNEKRDEAFIEKALFTMRKDGLDAAVLVTGGYHSQGLSRLMRRAGISYAVVTPRLSHETNVERYESVLLSDLGSENPLKKSSLAVSSSVGMPHETMMARSLVERNGGMYLSVVQNYLGHAGGRPPVVTPAGKASFTETSLPTRAEKTNFTLAGARLAETRPGYLSRLHEGIGERTPDWHRLSVVASVFLESQASVPASDLAVRVRSHLKDENLDVDDARVFQLVDRLVGLGLLRRESNNYALNVAPRLLAVKTDNAYFILDDLRKNMESGTLLSALDEYAQITQLWPNYPLESRWPVLRAVSLMHAHEQSSLSRALRENDHQRNSTLFDSILFMLDPSVPSDWFANHASSLIGRSIYYISPETWLVAGGLGRVGQYHTVNMKRLAGDHAEIVTIEPYYPFKHNHKGEMEKVDYSKLPTPVEGLSKEPFMEFEIPVAGKTVKAQVFKGRNQYGIEVYLIKDTENYYTRLMYRYGKEFGSSSWEEFTEFFSRSSLELMKRLEAEKQNAGSASYKAPVIVPNDGQLGLLPLYKRMMDASGNADDHVLKNASIWMVTHTYRNRGIFGFTNGRTMADGAGIHHPWDNYLTRIDTMDVTSAGIRTADGASAVAAVHRDEVSGIDPGVNEIAITNGDNREVSSTFFRNILQSLFPGADPEHPTAEQVEAVKREAKRLVSKDQRLIELNPAIATLNPDQMTVGYYGRLVDEKAGRKRAFTDDNIRAMVAAGVQVLIFGNIQSHTKWMFDDLKKIEAEVNAKGPGRLIVVTGWSLPEQIKMLAATDIQMQDSDRETGASEYTESDVSANGGLQASPPWIEGIIAKQGIVVNWNKPGFGNTLIPKGEKPSDYLELILHALELFNKDRVHFASYQAASIRLSRILEASLTAAEYLRQFNALGYRNDDPTISLIEFIKAKNGAQNYMNNPWLRRKLAEALAASHYAREINTHNPLLRAFLTDIDGSKRIVVLDTQMGHAVHEEPGLLDMTGFFSGSLINPKTKLTVVDSASGAKYDTYSVEDLLSKGLPIMIRYPGLQILELDRPSGARLTEQHNDYEVDMGERYWNGDLKTTPITRPFRASRKEDVPMISELTDADALRLERLGAESIARGEGVFSMLIAGASSRMNTHEAPADVERLVEGKDLKSKAAVPIGVTEGGGVTTYLGEYGQNLSRFLGDVEREAKRAGKASRAWDNGVLFLSNDEYRSEHDALLAEHKNYGLRPDQIRFFHQPLGPKFVGTPADVEKLKTKFAKPEDYEAASAYSKEVEVKLKAGERDAVMLAGERDPWGHGEYLHQLVASGELLGIVDAGRKWIAVKNVDNYSSKFDKIFSRILGMFLEQQLDFQPEVSPRSPGQKGGSLIVMEDNNAHQLAEDPNIAASNTSVKPTDSYWFNNAVAIMSPRYVISLYKKDGQSDEDFIAELREADEAGRQKIADRGRQKFPKIFDAKPAKKTKAVAIKPETNMWQSSGVVPPYIKIRAIGVNGVRNLPIESYLHGMSPAEKQRELAAMRFLSTKMWSKSAKEIEETRAAMEAAMGRKVTDNELMVTLETYEGNKILAADVLRYNRNAELVTAGIFSASIAMPNGTYTGDQFRLRATSGQHPVDNSTIVIETTDGRMLNGVYQSIKNNDTEIWVEFIEPDSSASVSISLSRISKVTINPAGARLVMNDAELRKTGLAMIAKANDPYVTQDAVKSLLPDGVNIIKFKNENVVSVDNPLMLALRRFFDDNPSWRMKGTPNEDTHAYVSYNDMTFNDARKRSGRLYFFTRDTTSSTTISFSVGMGAFVYFLGELLSSGKPSEKLVARELLTEVETEKFNANPTASQTISLDRFAKRADAILTSKADPVVSQGRLARFVKQPYNQTTFVNFRIDAGTLKLVQEAGIHIGVYAKSVSASTKPQPDYRTYVKFGEERYEFVTKGAFILFIAQVLEVNPRIARAMVMEAETQISTPLAGARLAEGPTARLSDLRAAYIQAVVEYRDFLAPYPQGAFNFMGDPVLMARNVELMTSLGQKREGYVRAQYLRTPLPLQFEPAIRETLDGCNLIPARRMLEERKIADIVSEMKADVRSGSRLSAGEEAVSLEGEHPIWKYLDPVINAVYDYFTRPLFVAPLKPVFYTFPKNYPVLSFGIAVVVTSFLAHVFMYLFPNYRPFRMEYASFNAILQTHAVFMGALLTAIGALYDGLVADNSVIRNTFARTKDAASSVGRVLFDNPVWRGFESFMVDVVWDRIFGPIFIGLPRMVFYEFPWRFPATFIVTTIGSASILSHTLLYSVGSARVASHYVSFQHIVVSHAAIFGAVGIVSAFAYWLIVPEKSLLRDTFVNVGNGIARATVFVATSRPVTATLKALDTFLIAFYDYFVGPVFVRVPKAFLYDLPRTFPEIAIFIYGTIASTALNLLFLAKPNLLPRELPFFGSYAVRTDITVVDILRNNALIFTPLIALSVTAYLATAAAKYFRSIFVKQAIVWEALPEPESVVPDLGIDFTWDEVPLAKPAQPAPAPTVLASTKPAKTSQPFTYGEVLTIGGALVGGFLLGAYLLFPPLAFVATVIVTSVVAGFAILVYEFEKPAPRSQITQRPSTPEPPASSKPTPPFSGARLAAGSRTLQLQAPLETQIAYWKAKSRPELPISVRRVLIADNAPDFADGIKRLVKRALPDAEIVVVSSGAEALNAYQAAENPSHPFDLIFTDNNMEDLNAGLSFIENVRDIEDSLGIERESTKGVIVAIVSGSLQNVDSRLASQSRIGVNTFGIAKNGAKTMVPELRLLIATLTGKSVESLVPQLSKLEEPEKIEVRAGTRLSLLEKPAVAVTPAVQDEIRQFGARLTLRDGIRNFVAGKVYPFLTLAGIALITITATPDASAAEVSATLAGSPAVISKTTVDPVRVRADIVRERNEKTKETLLKTPTALPETSRDLAEPKESIADVVGSLMLANPALAQFIATWNNGYAKNAWNRLSAALGKSAVGAPPAEHYTITIPYAAIFDRSGDVQSVVDMKETLKALAAVMKAHPVQFTVLFTNQDAPLDVVAEARVRASLEAWTEREVAQGRSLSLEFLQVRAEETLVASVRGHIDAENFQNLAKVIVGVDVKADPGRIGTKESLKNSPLDNKVEFYGVETPSVPAAQVISAAAIVFTAVKTVMPELIVPAELGITLRKEKTPFGEMYVVHPLNLDRELLQTLLSKQTTSRAA